MSHLLGRVCLYLLVLIKTERENQELKSLFCSLKITQDLKMEPTQTSEEAPLLVSTAQAAKVLGVSSTYIAALKKAAGCGGSHRIRLNWLTDYLDKNPNFRVRGETNSNVTNIEAG